MLNSCLDSFIRHCESFSNLYGVFLWDNLAVMLQNRFCPCCTTSALHNKMKITLQFILQNHLKQVSVALCSSPSLCCRLFFPLFSFSRTAQWNPRLRANVTVKNGKQRAFSTMKDTGGLRLCAVQTHTAQKVHKTVSTLIQLLCNVPCYCLLAALTLFS